MEAKRLRRLRGLMWAWLGLLCLRSASPAAAYEDRLALGAGPAVDLILDREAEADLPELGFGVQAAGAIGLGDTWALRGTLDVGWHPQGGGPDLHLAVLGTELIYVLDVLRLVPWFGVGVDVAGTLFRQEGGLELGAHGAAGVEYFLDRAILLGVDARLRYVPLDLVAEPRLGPLHLALAARITMLLDL